MSFTKSQDETTHLQTLGTGKMPTPSGAPGLAQLESFPNCYPNRNYIISIAYPEFTSLCPVTGQPDLGTIVVEYIPDRNHQSFMETITNSVLEHMWELLEPRWCYVKGLFVPRGGTHIHVYAERYKDMPANEEASLRQTVQDWKADISRINTLKI